MAAAEAGVENPLTAEGDAESPPNSGAEEGSQEVAAFAVTHNNDEAATEPPGLTPEPLLALVAVPAAVRTGNARSAPGASDRTTTGNQN
eukprot:COSAG06_NODE_5999_length_3162_cov_3.330069_2_plen_89_part_00